MGLYVHSLGLIPMELEKSYYLYVLDYGWHEPLRDAILSNFSRIADLAGKNDAVALFGTDPRAFADEILSAHIDDSQFSWRNVNGEDGKEILPALMISNINPRRFRGEFPDYCFPEIKKGVADEKLILIPLKGFCNSSTEVVALIERIFRDIAAKKQLLDFAVAKEIRAERRNAISDALILRPTFYGMGVDIKEIIRAWPIKNWIKTKTSRNIKS